MNYRRILLITIVLTFFSMPTFAEDNFLDNLNTTIDNAQEKLNNAADDLEVVAEKAGAVIEDTKEYVGEAVEEIKVFLSDLDNHWAKQYIEELISKSIVGGYPDGTFKPNATITRAEFTKILMAGIYDDIDYTTSTPWYQTYADTAITKGIIENGEFTDYTKEITRYEMARMLARAGEDTSKFQVESTNKTTFQDDADIIAEGKAYIMTVSDAGIITGYPDGSFGPNKNATRAEASVMLNRFLDLEAEEAPVVAENKVDQMIANVLNSTAKKPYTLDQIQEMADNGLIGKIGTARVENGKIVVVEPESHDDDPEKAMEILKVLAAHAEANGHAVALTGGNSLAMGVAYAESLDRIKNDDYLFAIRFNRNVSFAMDKEIDGKTYTFDEGVEIKSLYDQWHLERSGISFDEQDEYKESQEYMEEDILNALYDGLRTFDGDCAEDLFKKMVVDYRYSKSHRYKSGEKNEFFTLDSQLIYKDDWRGAGGNQGTTTYSFEE